MHILQFDRRSELIWAFGRLLDSRWVESCVADPAELRLRFRADARRAGPLIERIYTRGGPTWASRHGTQGEEHPQGYP
jgi:hypothetical protein